MKLLCLLFFLISTPLVGQESAKSPSTKRVRPTEVGPAINQNIATPIEKITAAKGFQVELLYSVPGTEQGSWVNLCVDPKGRILASDQYGGLYRMVPPPAGKPLDPANVEKLPIEIRAVNGMLWAFDALYVGVNDYEGKIPSGLYRLSDSDQDDQLDKVECLRPLEARGDHGVHAVLLTPDGKSLFLVCGNATKLTETIAESKVPRVWGEDHLLPRLPDGRGFMRDVLGPGGVIYRVSPDGTEFDMYATGFRNIFDAAVSQAGELFTFDADMEYDFNTSWYRPTRINHVVSGAEFGWRNGAGKRPEFYPDNLPATINIGPGSPTGVTFGYGARFPEKYQSALYALDWSWGKLYAIHLEPEGATYRATKEEFITGFPLPLTDAIIHPGDGAMYFAIGGRRVQSGLYRVTYTGSESTARATVVEKPNPLRDLRRELETHHGTKDLAALDVAWPHLGHGDRFIRWAARTVLEHRPVAAWAQRALDETDPAKRVEALLGLARAGGVCPQHRTEQTPPVDVNLRDKLLASLNQIDPETLTGEEKLTWLRAIEITLNRFGRPDQDVISRLIAKLDPLFPSRSLELNWLLCETLVYLQSPTVAAKGVALIEASLTQEEQIEYARSLRMLTSGWDLPLRTRYFEWLARAANYRGGASFEKFIEFIRQDAIKTLNEEEKLALQPLLERKVERKSPLEMVAAAFAGRPSTDWTVEKLATEAMDKLVHRSFDNGRKMFAAAACFQCHRFGNEGGMTGPDLTSAGRRYSPRDLLDQIVNPSKEINEQFVPVEVVTEEGNQYRGVVVNLNGDSLTLNTDLTDPDERKTIDRKDIIRLGPSKLSPMPAGLLNPMTLEEILDLTAFVLSGGDPNHPSFQ